MTFLISGEVKQTRDANANANANALCGSYKTVFKHKKTKQNIQTKEINNRDYLLSHLRDENVFTQSSTNSALHPTPLLLTSTDPPQIKHKSRINDLEGGHDLLADDC